MIEKARRSLMTQTCLCRDDGCSLFLSCSFFFFHGVRKRLFFSPRRKKKEEIFTSSKLFAVSVFVCVFTFLCVFQYYSRYTKEAHAHAYCLEFISLSLSLCVSRIITMLCLVFHARTTNLLVKDSRCRGGGIVNILGRCSRVLTVRWLHPKALWLLRVSTSNSPSDLSRPHTNTHFCQIHRIHARRDIRGCGDDHLQPPRRQFSNPMRFGNLV